MSTTRAPQRARPDAATGGLRVAYFAEIFPSESETWIHHEIRELIRRGCSVRVFATRPRPARVPAENEDMVALTRYLPEVPGVDAATGLGPAILAALRLAPSIALDCSGARLRAQALRSLLHMARFLKTVDDFAPDVIHVHFAGSRANMALLHHLIRGTPYFVKMHAADVWARPGLFRLKVNRSAGIFITSRAAADFVRAHNPDVDQGRISEQMVGVPVDAFAGRSSDPGTGIPRFLSVARLVPMKGLHVLLEASALLRDRGVDHRIMIIGDGPERQRLLRMRDELGLADLVEFRGYGTPEDVRLALAAATAFVLPCIWDEVEQTQDGMPIALMEAMASGVPVISTTVSGIPELIQDGRSGLLVPPVDSAALAGALERTITAPPQEREAMVRNARKAITEIFNTELVTADLMAAFEAAARPAAQRGDGQRT